MEVGDELSMRHQLYLHAGEYFQVRLRPGDESFIPHQYAGIVDVHSVTPSDTTIVKFVVNASVFLHPDDFVLTPEDKEFIRYREDVLKFHSYKDQLGFEDLS